MGDVITPFMALTESTDSAGRVRGSMFTCVCGSRFGGQDAALSLQPLPGGRCALWTSQGVWWTLQVLLHLERCTQAAGLWSWEWV